MAINDSIQGFTKNYCFKYYPTILEGSAQVEQPTSENDYRENIIKIAEILKTSIEENPIFIENENSDIKKYRIKNISIVKSINDIPEEEVTEDMETLNEDKDAVGQNSNYYYRGLYFIR